MKKITVVGCGFLGSLLIEELCKRAFAFEEKLAFTFIDDGCFESRNCANQNVSLHEAGQQLLKTEVMSRIAYAYDMPCLQMAARLTKATIGKESIGLPDLIIDAVDNIPTRQLLWTYGVMENIPVLHTGLSQEGTGAVEWTYGDGFDNFSLSPIALIHKLPDEIEAMGKGVQTLPPCELIAFRGCGLNLTIAAAKAIFIYFGFDPEGEVLNDGNTGEKFLVSWFADNNSHTKGEIHHVTG